MKGLGPQGMQTAAAPRLVPVFRHRTYNKMQRLLPKLVDKDNSEDNDYLDHKTSNMALLKQELLKRKNAQIQ